MKPVYTCMLCSGTDSVTTKMILQRSGHSALRLETLNIAIAGEKGGAEGVGGGGNNVNLGCTGIVYHSDLLT